MRAGISPQNSWNHYITTQPTNPEPSLALNHTPSKPTPAHPQPLSISPITYLFLHPLYLSTLYTTYYMSSTYATPYYSSLIMCLSLISF